MYVPYASITGPVCAVQLKSVHWCNLATIDRTEFAVALPNGLFKVAFETPTGADYGVAYLHDGKLRGGDSGMAYLGTYKQEGQLFSAEMSVTQHRHVPGAVSALGFNDMVVELHGIV
ncbi:MAG: hypothetical protein EOO77_36425, partial [Oxalobacteraceae bacterium]